MRGVRLLPGKYSPGEVGKMLGLTEITVRRLRGAGVLPHSMVNGRAYYDTEYIDALAALWAQYPKELKKPCDIMFFKLFMLQWAYTHPPSGVNPHQRRVYKEQVQAESMALLTTHNVQIGESVAHAIEKPMHTLWRWVRLMRIAPAVVNKRLYFSARYAAYLTALYTEWNTIADAADITQLHANTINARILSGKISAVRCSDGLWRISPATTASIVAEPQLDESGGQLLTYKIAARRLGVELKTLVSAVHRGHFSANGGRTTMQHIARVDLARWEQRFTRMNSEFAWLQATMTRPDVKPATLSPNATMSVLGISPATLTIWSQDGLLPFFVRSFTPDGENEYREFVRRYVHALRRFAGQTPVRKRAARKYFELCKKNSQIM